LKKKGLWHDSEQNSSAEYWWTSTGEERPDKRSKGEDFEKEKENGQRSSTERKDARKQRRILGDMGLFHTQAYITTLIKPDYEQSFHNSM
jgi:hypothetical protein